MNKKQIRKEFNEFLDSASDEQIRDFLKFMKERREKKQANEKEDPFKDRLN
jgi:hypothetical protein